MTQAFEPEPVPLALDVVLSAAGTLGLPFPFPPWFPFPFPLPDGLPYAEPVLVASGVCSTGFTVRVSVPWGTGIVMTTVVGAGPQPVEHRADVVKSPDGTPALLLGQPVDLAVPVTVIVAVSVAVTVVKPVGQIPW